MRLKPVYWPTEICGKAALGYNFGTNTNDPNQPEWVTLAQGTDGNLYGVSANGGSTDDTGAMFNVTPGGVLTTLYAFSGQNFGPSNPFGGLTLGTDGFTFCTKENL